MWPDRRVVELFEIDHPIVLAPMAGLGTVQLAAAVSSIHPAHLRNSLMAFVDHTEEVFWKIVKQTERSCAGHPPVKKA